MECMDAEVKAYTPYLVGLKIEDGFVWIFSRI